MIKYFTNKWNKPLTYGWYWKTCGISALIGAVMTGISMIIIHWWEITDWFERKFCRRQKTD